MDLAIIEMQLAKISSYQILHRDIFIGKCNNNKSKVSKIKRMRLLLFFCVCTQNGVSIYR